MSAAATFEVPDRLDSAAEWFDVAYSEGWTDGLPVLPPTPAAVERMLSGSVRKPGAAVATLPPQMFAVSVRDVAICAVMAGCRPSYLPVVLAAVEALADPRYDLGSVNTSSSPIAPLLLVNGPVIDRIALNVRWGHMGPGFRANATIGRAVNLVMTIFAGRRSGDLSMCTHSQPGQYAFCIGEWESRSPWESYQAEHGLSSGESCVTAFAVLGTTGVIDYTSRTADGLLATFASSITAIASPHQFPYFGLAPVLLALCPDHADKLAGEGFSKADVKQAVFERTRDVPIGRWPDELQAALLESGRAKGGVVPMLARPDQVEIVVCGGLSGLHTVFLPTAGFSWPVTRSIEPASPGAEPR